MDRFATNMYLRSCLDGRPVGATVVAVSEGLICRSGGPVFYVSRSRDFEVYEPVYTCSSRMDLFTGNDLVIDVQYCYAIYKATAPVTLRRFHASVIPVTVDCQVRNCITQGQTSEKHRHVFPALGYAGIT